MTTAVNKGVMAAIFAAGLAVVAWVGWGFGGSSPLALAMTVGIGCVYAFGACELMQFRAATQSLERALAAAGEEPVADLPQWLARLAPALRSPVHQRLQGDRVALPAPVLAPYLVGLLVMLGMLGTFVGMVATFQGAVFALEASSNLDSIRNALAAPIKGLGLAFGTSVAGVAASAALGLLSAMSRRQRLEAVRLLDARMSTAFRAYSPARQREDMLAALQTQATTLPLVAERLHSLVDSIAQRNDDVNQQLIAQQGGFHREAAEAYRQLASTVGTSLQDSLSASARQAGDTILPVVQQAMAALSQEAERSHARLRAATDGQLGALTAQWEGTAHQVAQTWDQAVDRQVRHQTALLDQLQGAFAGATEALDARSRALVASLQADALQARAAQHENDRQRLEGWNAALHTTAQSLAGEWQQVGAASAAQQQAVGQALAASAAQLERSLDTAAQAFDQRANALVQSLQQATAQALAQQTMAEQQRLALWHQGIEDTSASLGAQWRQVGDEAAQLQRGVGEALAATAAQLESGWQAAAVAFEQRSSGLLQAIHAFAMQTRTAQAADDHERQSAWADRLQGVADGLQAQQRAAGDALAAAAEQLEGHLQRSGDAFGQRSDALLETLQTSVAQAQAAQHVAEVQRAQALASAMEGLSAQLAEQWQRMGERTVQQQQGVCQALEATARQVTEHMAAQVHETLGSAQALMAQSDTLMRTRTQAEHDWVQAQGERMQELTGVWRTELQALRDAEAQRGQAAVDRLDTLQAAVAEHLAALGSSLEAPLSRLLQTAADVPQAAAQVITQLREEMTHMGERDNLALAERTALMAQVATLLQSLNHAAAQQSGAIDTLVHSAAQVLEQAGAQFVQVLGTQASTVDGVAIQVAASAVELASLGESFSHGVGEFSSSNQALVEALRGMEQAITQSMGRSDEQMAYYVAQAREVVDLSLSAQQGIVEDLRRLHAGGMALQGQAA